MAQNPLVKTPQAIQTDMLATYRAGLQTRLGIADPQIGAGTDIFNKFQAISNELAVAEQNTVIQSDATLADTASGTDLDRLCNSYGIVRRPAFGSSGGIRNTSSITSGVNIPDQSQLISNNGKVYIIDLGGIYSNTDIIPVSSKDLGSDTNLGVNQVLTWLSTPPYSQTTTLIVNAIEGGADAEDDETLRARLFSLLQNPPLFGNWSSIANLTSNFRPNTIKATFVYPACNGPSTQHLACSGYSTVDLATRSRELNDVDLSEIESYVLGNTPDGIQTVVTTVADVAIDVAFSMIIPFPVGSPNLGTGGGWLDQSPFPVPNASGSAHDGTSNFSFCYVATAGIDNNHFTLAAPSGGFSNRNNKVSWIFKSSLGWRILTSTISSATDLGGGRWTIVLVQNRNDQPFTGIAVNDYIFPASQNAQTYLNTALSSLGDFGPGEKNNVSTLLPRANRKPLPAISSPSGVDARVSDQIIRSSNEVLDCQFYARRTDASGEIGIASPALPVLISDPPNIFIPRQIGFYPSQ